MGVFTASGTRRTKAAVATTTVTDPEVVVTEDLYATRAFDAVNDKTPEGSIKEVLVKAGAVVRQSDIDGWFPPATVATVSPATGTTAGGTTVTLTGTNLDGVTAVTFGGTAATSVTVVSATQVTCVTPAKTAGAVSVVVTDDSGTVTKTNAYTYA